MNSIPQYVLPEVFDCPHLKVQKSVNEGLKYLQPIPFYNKADGFHHILLHAEIKKALIISAFWFFSHFCHLDLRRRGDSNPRYSFPYDSLANCWFKPLTHLSGIN